MLNQLFRIMTNYFLKGFLLICNYEKLISAPAETIMEFLIKILLAQLLRLKTNLMIFFNQRLCLSTVCQSKVSSSNRSALQPTTAKGERAPGLVLIRSPQNTIILVLLTILFGFIELNTHTRNILFFYTDINKNRENNDNNMSIWQYPYNVHIECFIGK